MPGATTDEFLQAVRSRNRLAINQAAARLIEQRAPLGEQWFSVAQVLLRTGEVRHAVAAGRLAVEQTGHSGRTRFHLAALLSDVGQQEEAIALASALTPTDISPLARDHLVGTCALELGDFERARRSFDQVVSAWPGSGPTWLSLAALPAQDDAELLGRLNAAAPAIARAEPEYRAQGHYAMGTVLDRLHRLDEAFAEFMQGAALVRARRSFDPQADRREAEALIQEFDRPAIEGTNRRVSLSTDRAILVTGLPRSGTTLVEQILTSHSRVSGGGEMPFGAIVTREVGGNAIERLNAFDADALAGLYLHLADERFGHEGRFVDKCLDTNRSLGLLASVLPDAPIIWVERNPLDCAWSCFRTYFSDGVAWSWSLPDIASHFAADQLLHRHWQEVLGDRMLTVSYEALATEPDRQISRILAHAGLDADSATAAAHATPRAVTTASVAQVREPIYQRSIGNAQRYRRHLEPFVSAFEAAL